MSPDSPECGRNVKVSFSVKDFSKKFHECKKDTQITRSSEMVQGVNVCPHVVHKVSVRRVLVRVP